MKLLHVITGLETGGAELMLLRLLQEMDRSLFTSTVISLTDVGPTGRQMREAGITVEALGMRRGRLDPRALVKLARIIRRHKPDVVQTWLYHADLAGGLAARLAGGVPVAWGLHLANLAPELNKRSTMLVARLSARLSGWLPAAIVCCAEATRRAHIAYGYRAERMLVIPNGFDLDRFHPSDEARVSLRRELGVPPETLLVGLVARSDPQKDHQTFVAAAGLLRRRHDVAFVLCGAGITPAHRDLVAAIEAAGITDRCHLLGRRDDMPRVQAALDIACSSSRGEAFPLAIGEAMAAGVPCVVTDVGDSALLVGETGRIVPPGDPAALAAALAEVVALGAAGRAALGQAARRRIGERFSLRRVADHYEALYAGLAAGALPVPDPGVAP